ncbi:hypothetical protein FCM35_KLT21857 [Carex littledalei]|uniref:CCHC-type domain-containing protein n=1 Tax=Carex littledalei TaxID=544730 RepID=A0A833QG78_9POAL|nr:hypothetical protein FCM35_KLT21857 [Carex littledalei]
MAAQGNPKGDSRGDYNGDCNGDYNDDRTGRAIKNTAFTTTRASTDVQSQQGATHGATEFLLIGDLPVLRFIKNDSNGVVKVTPQLSSQHNDPEGKNVSDPSENNENPTVLRDVHISDLERTNNNDDSSGWTLVQRKKRRNTNRRLWNNQQSRIQVHAKKLRQQQRCFRCLLKGHIQAVCANPRKCLNCNKSGYVIRSCPLISKGRSNVSLQNPSIYKKEPQTLVNPIVAQPIPKENPPIKEPPRRPNKPSMEYPRNMEAPRNWQTVQMREPVELWQRRPHSLNVYLAPREGLAPSNRFLECASFVFVGPGASAPATIRRITNCMAREFRRDPRDFQIHKIDEDFGDLLLIFPDADMAEAANTRASFYIGNNITISLHPYSPELQMAFDPLYGRARIRIYGVPLQHWNRADMLTLAAGFGYPLRVAPYFTNGNYEYLTMLVATSDPKEIPFYLQLKVNPYEKEVRVEIDGWMMNERPPPPNQRRGRTSDDRRSQPKGNPREGPSNPEGGRRRGTDRNREQQDDMAISSSGSNRTRSAYAWMQNWLSNLKKALIAAGILTELPLTTPPQKVELAHLQITEYVPPLSPPIVLTPSKAELSLEGVKILDKSGMNLFNFTLLGPVTQMTNQTIFKGLKLVSGVIMAQTSDAVSTPLLQGIKEREIQTHDTSGLIIEPMVETEAHSAEDAHSPPPGFELPIYKDDHDDGNSEGPPPGFELPIYRSGPMLTATKAGKKISQANTNLKVRRSPRLEGKYRAGGKKTSSGKKVKGRKPAKAKIVQMAYQQSLDPLDMSQAQMIIKMAGVEVNGQIEEEVAKVIMG